MKFKKEIVIFSLLLVLLTITAASAHENITCDEPLSSPDNGESIGEDIQESDDENIAYTQCFEDIQVTITPSQKAVKVGDNIQLTITAKNIGKLPFKNLDISTRWDKESLHLISASASKGKVTKFNGYLSLTVDYLNPGEAATIILKTKALTKGDPHFICDIGTYGDLETYNNTAKSWAAAICYPCTISIEENDKNDLKHHFNYTPATKQNHDSTSKQDKSHSKLTKNHKTDNSPDLSKLIGGSIFALLGLAGVSYIKKS